MWFSKKQITFKHSKNKQENQYIIEYYNSDLSPEDVRYYILSWLREQKTIVTEVDSGLFSIQQNAEVDKIVDDIIYYLKQKDILFKYRKIKNEGATQNPIAKLFGFGSKKPLFSHKLQFSIPDSAWDMDALKWLVPVYGCRHSVLNDNQQLEEVLDNFDRGLYEDMLRSDQFYCDTFDCQKLSVFTIRSNFIQKDQIQQLVDKLNARAKHENDKNI